MTRTKILLIAFIASAALAAACSSDDSGGGDVETGETTSTTAAAADFVVHDVPEDFATIQEAADAAEPGDLILIHEGVYEEGVVVQTEDLVFRGTDRNAVILDGGFEKSNGFIISANGVAVENMTLRNYTGNGLFWTGEYDSDFTLTGWRASYITAHNNGNYGIYAFNATKGQIDNSYASGSPDSSFYVGQCNPCDALLYKVEGENSQLGYSGTNSTGVTIADSEFHNNIIGVVPNSQSGEELAPNAGTVIVGNWIHDNNNDAAPGKNDEFLLGHGTGVILIGVTDNIVERNLITDNDRFGVIILPWIFSEPRYDPLDNIVRDNVVTGEAQGAHLVLALFDSGEGAAGNCFANNEHETVLPEGLLEIAPCDAEQTVTGFEDIGAYIDRFAPGPPYVPYEDVVAPAYEFENMADALTAAPSPATNVPMDVDLDSLAVPTPG